MKKTDYALFTFLALLFLYALTTLPLIFQGLDPSNFMKSDQEIEERLVKIRGTMNEIHLAQPSTPRGFRLMYLETLMDLQSEEARLVNEQKRRKKQ